MQVDLARGGRAAEPLRSNGVPLHGTLKHRLDGGYAPKKLQKKLTRFLQSVTIYKNMGKVPLKLQFLEVPTFF